MNLQNVKKRDGRIVPFDRTKIADAIFKAAHSVGGNDRYLADDLAEAVTLYVGKEFPDRIPAVEEIQDIVERVLIKTGHARTAKSYILYRERRTRVRKVRQGLSPDDLALEEKAIALLREEKDLNLSVKGSNETIAGWEREKIVQALVKETDIPFTIAEIVALEVEDLVITSKITNPNAALIRELVNAKLVEYGFADARKKHARLGLPLYDARNLIFSQHSDPRTACLRLGQHIKKEYSLLEVFSQEVTDAHLKGDIHIHGLGQIDKLYYLIFNPEHVKKSGVALPDFPGRPPADSWDLTDQLLKFTEKTHRYFHYGMHLDGVNVFLAPFTRDLSDGTVRNVLRKMLYDFHFLQYVHQDTVSLGIHCSVPTILRETPALGPEGTETGETYGGYNGETARLMRTILEIYRDTPELSTIPTFFHGACDPGGGTAEPGAGTARGCSELLADLTRRRTNLYHVFQGETARFGGLLACGAGDASPAGGDMRFCYGENVSLNMPRIAYLAEGNDDIFFHLLNRSLEAAVKAQAEKRQFIDQLLARGERGPLGLLAREQEGEAFIRSGRSAGAIGILGLNEMAKYHTGFRLHENEEALTFVLRTLGHLAAECERHTGESGHRLSVVQTFEREPASRFSRLDHEYFPEHTEQVFPRMSGYSTYGHGFLDPDAGISAFDRISREAGIQQLLAGGALSVIPLRDVTAPGNILELLQRAAESRVASTLTFI